MLTPADYYQRYTLQGEGYSSGNNATTKAQEVLMKTLYEYLQEVDFHKIVLALLEIYKQCESFLTFPLLVAYTRVYDKLIHMEPKETDMIIDIHFYKDEEDLYHVSGLTTNPDEEWQGYWCIALTPWAEWLSMPIKDNNLEPHEVVAHCLWEMTFHGFAEREIREFKERLDDSVPSDEEVEAWAIQTDQI